MTILCFLLLIICSYTDIKERGISIVLLAVFSAFCAALMVSVSLFGDRAGFLKNCLMYEPGIVSILAGFIPGSILLVINRITKEAVGRGDVYVILLLGLMLGFEITFSLLLLSMMMTALFGLCCMLAGRRNRKDSLPYMPFLLVAFVALSVSGFISVKI